MLRAALIFLSENDVARRLSTRAPGARTLARRFVAGESVADGIDAARQLAETGYFVSLDYLGESVGSRAEARAAADTYVQVLQRIGSDPLLRQRVNVSLKLTQMGQDIRADVASTNAALTNPRATAAALAERTTARTAAISPAPAPAAWSRPSAGATPENRGDWDEPFLHDNVRRILDTARAHDIFVRFDMEDTAHTQRTLDFFRWLWDQGYRNIGVVLQSYLRRTQHDVREANLLGARVRLCKGAYREPEEYAFQARREVDAGFVTAMKALLSDGNYPGIATHDEDMIDATRTYAADHRIDSSGWEFQMLYGVRRDLQHLLLEQGYNVRVYVPFGEAWYPYLMRRMAERPANLFFIANAVLRESPLRFLFGRRRRRSNR